MRRGVLASLAALVFMTGLTVSAAAQDLYDCEDFTFWEDALAVFEQDRSDPHGLMGPVGPDNETGVTSAVVCPDLPSSSSVGGAGEGREERRANSPLLADRIPVCVQWFESPVLVEYFTQAQIDEIEATWAAYDYSDIPPPQIMGYPDPATGSCAPQAGDADGTEYALQMYVRNCATELVVYSLYPQEGCVPGVGAFFNISLNDGTFLGNCEATRSLTNPQAVFASCIVQVPSGSTVVITEDLASLPEGYVPETNPVTFIAPSGPVDGEDWGPVFINERRSGSIPTDLPNTGAGLPTTGADSMLLVTALSTVAGFLWVAGLHLRRQA
jgi:hypothetical protein